MEEKSKKDHRALLNQGEENELVSLPFFLLQDSQNNWAVGRGWSSADFRTWRGFSQGSIIVREPNALRKWVLIGTGLHEASASDILQRNQVHSYMRCSLLIFWVLRQLDKLRQKQTIFFIILVCLYVYITYVFCALAGSHASCPEGF